MPAQPKATLETLLAKGADPNRRETWKGQTALMWAAHENNAAAVRALEDNASGVMIALDPPHVKYIPIPEAIGKLKQVPLNSDIIQTARDMGITFGQPRDEDDRR